MPTQRKGARLWLRPARRGKSERIIARAVYLILDGGRHYPTGCFAGEADRAERKLAEHIAKKYRASRKERNIETIDVADACRSTQTIALRAARVRARNFTAASVVSTISSAASDCLR
jgi:hypothetical protein